MNRLTPSLLAMPLALALALTPAPVPAQQISTAQGERSLPRSQGLSSEVQARQALAATEEILRELLRDLDSYDRALSTAREDATGLATKLEAAKADYERAKSSFEGMDQQYRNDLAAFQQREAALEADMRNQRAQHAALDAIPSAQRNHADVVAINDWASRIDNENQAVRSEQVRLLADHDRVEDARTRLAKQRADAESQLKASREGIVGQLASTDAKRKLAYRDLRVTVKHMQGLRAQYAKIAAHEAPASRALETATRKLATWDQAPAASR